MKFLGSRVSRLKASRSKVLWTWAIAFVYLYHSCSGSVSQTISFYKPYKSNTLVNVIGIEKHFQNYFWGQKSFGQKMKKNVCVVNDALI